MRFEVKRDCDTFRLRKIVIEIYSQNGGYLLDRTRMFGVIFNTEKSRERLRRKINRRIARRVLKAQVFEKAGTGG